MQVYGVLRPYDRRCRFRKENRIVGSFRLSRFIEFDDVFTVVLADTKNVARPVAERCQYMYGMQRFCRNGAGFFICFKTVCQGEKPFRSLIDEFFQRFRQGCEERFFQGNGTVYAGTVLRNNTPLFKTGIFKGD